MAPRTAWEKFWKRSRGAEVPTAPSNRDQFLLDFLPIKSGVVTREDVEIDCRWQDLKIESEPLERDNTSILNLVVRTESYSVQGRIWEALEARQRIPRVTNTDLRGYRRAEPGWIADRICCLSTAAEICRMMADREPALQRVRDVLETYPAAKRLVSECRLCRRRSHNWRQFPTQTNSAVHVDER